MKVTTTKIFEFAYAHYLPGHEGKCVNLHGHTGRLEVTISGVKGSVYPGMTVDFYDIKRIIQPIVDDLNHKFLNEVLNDKKFSEWTDKNLAHVEEKGILLVVPTAENLIKWIKMRIEQQWPGVELSRIRLWESPTSYCEWDRE